MLIAPAATLRSPCPRTGLLAEARLLTMQVNAPTPTGVEAILPVMQRGCIIRAVAQRMGIQLPPWPAEVAELTASAARASKLPGAYAPKAHWTPESVRHAWAEVESELNGAEPFTFAHAPALATRASKGKSGSAPAVWVAAKPGLVTTRTFVRVASASMAPEHTEAIRGAKVPFRMAVVEFGLAGGVPFSRHHWTSPTMKVGSQETARARFLDCDGNTVSGQLNYQGLPALVLQAGTRMPQFRGTVLHLLHQADPAWIDATFALPSAGVSGIEVLELVRFWVETTRDQTVKEESRGRPEFFRRQISRPEAVIQLQKLLAKLHQAGQLGETAHAAVGTWTEDMSAAAADMSLVTRLRMQPEGGAKTSGPWVDRFLDGGAIRADKLADGDAVAGVELLRSLIRTVRLEPHLLGVFSDDFGDPAAVAWLELIGGVYPSDAAIIPTSHSLKDGILMNSEMLEWAAERAVVEAPAGGITIGRRRQPTAEEREISRVSARPDPRVEAMNADMALMLGLDAEAPVAEEEPAAQPAEEELDSDMPEVQPEEEATPESPAEEADDTATMPEIRPEEEATPESPAEQAPTEELPA